MSVLLNWTSHFSDDVAFGEPQVRPINDTLSVPRWLRHLSLDGWISVMMSGGICLFSLGFPDFDEVEYYCYYHGYCNYGAYYDF